MSILIVGDCAQMATFEIHGYFLHCNKMVKEVNDCAREDNHRACRGRKSVVLRVIVCT